MSDSPVVNIAQGGGTTMGFFIGNTAESVLQQVNCSVLTVKPEGFVSPVTLDD